MVARHDGITLDGHRQHEAIVVIGVFADDVDAAGRGDDPTRRTAVGFGKLLCYVGGEFRECHE